MASDRDTPNDSDQQITEPADIPDSIVQVLREDEIENIINRNGWAIGTVVHIEGGQEVERREGAIIELFNGNGRSGEFSGVKFMASDGEDYEEAYAYVNKKTFDARGREDGWYVDEYDGEDVDYGMKTTDEDAVNLL